MSDNGPCYKSLAFRRACKQLGLRHIRTRPYTPKTNGKAERFIQTTLREWAYAQAYQAQTSDGRSCPTGCIPTTGTGLILASMIKSQSAASVSPRTTC
jgi:transposase InsO family protein